MFHFLPSSACADGNLAELVGQLGNVVEYPNKSQYQIGQPVKGWPDFQFLS